MTPVTLLTLTVSTGTGTATYRYADVQTDAYPAYAPRLAAAADLEESAATPLTRSLPVRRARVRLSNVAVPHYTASAPTVSQILGAGQDVVGAQASVQVADADTGTVLTTISGYVEEITALSLTEATLVVSDALAGDASTLLPCALTDLFPSVQAPEGTALAVICGTARRVRLYPVTHDDVVQVTWDIPAGTGTPNRRARRRYRDIGGVPRIQAGDRFAYEVWRSTPDDDAYFTLRVRTTPLPDLDDMVDQNGVRNDSYAGTPMGCAGWYRRVFPITRGIGTGVIFYALQFKDQGGAAQAGTARFARAVLLDAAGNVRHTFIGERWATDGNPPQSNVDVVSGGTFTVESDFGYEFGAWRTGTGVSVAHAYLNGRRMAPSEYTVVSPLPGVSALKLTLEDDRPPPDGAVVHADFTSTEFAGNPATVTEFFLSDADHGLGRAVDATQFTAAAAAYTTRKLTVGGAVTKRTPAATLLQEFLLHGAVLTHGSGPGGPIGMQVDAPGTPAALELGHADETGWRNFTPANAAPVRAAAQPKSLLVRGVLDPGFAGEPERWLATTKRSRTFPRGAEHDVAYRYIVDPDSLDRQAHYLWEQMQAQATPLTGDLTVTEPDAYALDVGDRLVVTVPGLGLARADYRIGGFRNRGAQFGLTLHPYRAAAFIYAAGTDRVLDPQARELVDWSRTQPQAPTALAVAADALRTLPDGTHEVSVTASVTAPVAPVDQIYFKLVKTGGVAARAEATVPCTPRETGVSATLRAESGAAYTLEAYAEMSTNDAGFRRGDAVTGTATAVVDPDATLTPGRPGFNAVVPLPLYTGGAGTLDLVGEWHAAGVASTDTAWPASLSLTLVTATEETRDQLLALRTGHHVALYDDATRWMSGVLTATPTAVEFTASSQTRWRITLAFTNESDAGVPAFSGTNRGAQLNYSVPAPHTATRAEIWIRTDTRDVPAKPSSNATFTRYSGTVTALSAGWSDDVPASGGRVLWRLRAPVPEGWGNTYAIVPTAWEIPREVSHDGLRYFEAAIFRAQAVTAAAPARPIGGSYDFATRTLTPPAGWSAPPGPALRADQRLYVSAATAHDGAGDTWRPIVGAANLVSQSVATATAAGSWVSADLTGDPAVTTAAAPATDGPEPPTGWMFVAKGKAAEDRRTEPDPAFGGNRLDIVAYLRGSGDPSGSTLQIGARFDYVHVFTAATTAYLTSTAITDNRWTRVTGSLTIPAGADRITPRIQFTGTGVADSATINFGDVAYTVVDLDAWTTPLRAAQDAAVNMVYKRSASQPAALRPGPLRIPSTTSDSATAAPGSGRLWENFGTRPPESANWTWGGWRKAEGADGATGPPGPEGPPGPTSTTPGPAGTPGSTTRYAYVALTTQAQPTGSNAPRPTTGITPWATGRTSGNYPRPSGATVTYSATAPQATRSRQYVGRFSRVETGSTATAWVWEGIVASWVPAPNLHRDWITGGHNWIGNRVHAATGGRLTGTAYMKRLFPGFQPAIGDLVTQWQFSPTARTSSASVRTGWSETRVWNGSDFVSDYEISGANLIVESLGARMNIAVGGAIKTNNYRPPSSTFKGSGVYISDDYNQFPAANIIGEVKAANIDANVINAYFFSSNPASLSGATERTINMSTGGVALNLAPRAVGLLIYYTKRTGPSDDGLQIRLVHDVPEIEQRLCACRHAEQLEPESQPARLEGLQYRDQGHDRDWREPRRGLDRPLLLLVGNRFVAPQEDGMAVRPFYAVAWVDGTGTVTWANPPSVRGPFVWSTDDLIVSVAAFAQTPRAGDRIDLLRLAWAPPSPAAAQNVLASYDGLDVADGHGLLVGHTVDPARLSYEIDHVAKTLWVTYTVNTVTYYTDERGNVVRQADRQNWWGMRGVLVRVPAAAYTRTDWTNGIVAAIDASPEFPVEVLGREAMHFTKARNDFRQAENTRTAVDELAPSVQSPALRSALRSLQQSSGLTCRDVEVESRRTAFARGVMAVIDRARTITDEWSVHDDAMNLGRYVEAALAAVGGTEATEAMLRTLCTRMQDDLRSRTPVTFDGAKGAAVGAAANGAEHATLTAHVHCLVMDVVGVPDPIDLTPAEKKRFRLRADVPDSGIKVNVPDPLADVPDRSVVALELTGSGDTPLQRRFDGQTTWHAWTNPTIGDLLVAGCNQTVWFRPEPEGADADV